MSDELRRAEEADRGRAVAEQRLADTCAAVWRWWSSRRWWRRLPDPPLADARQPRLTG